MNAPVLFEQVSATSLYETRVAETVGWAGYVLPNVLELPPTIQVGESLNKYKGYYIFAVKRPPVVDTDPAGFAKDVVDYVKKTTATNRAALWLKNSEPVEFGDFKKFAFMFSTDINQNWVLRSDINAALGTNLTFFVLQNVVLSASDATGQLFLKIRSQVPNIAFQKGSSNLGIVIGDGLNQSARIPLSGTNTGCMVFNATMTPATTFGSKGLQLGLKYVVNNTQTGQQQSIYYSGFNAAKLPPSLICVGTVDPSDPVNTRIQAADLQKGHLRTGLAIAGAPFLPSNFLTPQGKQILLIPLGTPLDATTPPLMAGAFALASDALAKAMPGTADVYFAPAESFALAVDGVHGGKQQSLMCGLFGSERIEFKTFDDTAQANDTLFLLPSRPAYAPIFPFETATMDNPESGNVRERLKGDYVTCWATIFARASNVEYSAEPDGSPLYSPPVPCGEDIGTMVLHSSPPKMALPQGVNNTFPLAPYAGSASSGTDGDTLTRFESQIIAPTRKSIISSAATKVWEARAQAMLNASNAIPTYSTTPQGFIVQTHTASGAYLNVQLAQSADQNGLLSPFAFDNPTLQLQDALQTNQLFLVAVNKQYLDDSSKGARFDNVVHMVDWTMKAQVGKGATPTSYRNVMILKFCSGSLQERVTNPNRWTSPEKFSLLADAGEGTIAYTGLSQWLQDYIAEGIKRAEGRSSAFYKNFKNIVTDPLWNGVIVFEADLAVNDLPIQIRGLAAGINLAEFVAHHFGFTVSRVSVDKTTCKITMDGDSSLFGLIDYEDPAYALNLDTGVDPNTPIPVETSNDFDFTVLQLQSLFENTRLVEFKSFIQLTVDRLFGSDVVKTYSNRLPMPANGVVLDGSYIDQNGTASYVFQQTDTTVFALDSNVLMAVAFNRTQFNTLGERDNGATVASRFLIWGAFDFVEMADAEGGLFDVLSFGSPAGTPPSELGAGLAFSNLILGMSFPSATPNAKTFALNTDNLAYDLGASESRDESLFKGFGLQLKTFINASGDKTPANYGFLPVTSPLSVKQLGKAWFGIVYEVTMGGPGALASAVGFTSNMLLAWSPGTTGEDTQREVFIGLSLPGAAPGAKLFSIQGIFKLSIGSIALLRQEVPGKPEQKFYCLRLDDIALKIFGIVKLPPDATIQFFLFGDPRTTGSLGWYAAYVADKSALAQEENPSLPPVKAELLPAANPVIAPHPAEEVN
ncbi:MAG TPA: hypothetical protein VJZ26_10050 [Blastocatellia bacterium]|nr:hypothetical protein [Blastocatellia bacterium]